MGTDFLFSNLFSNAKIGYFSLFSKN